MVFVIFEIEICDLVCLFSTLLYKFFVDRWRIHNLKFYNFEAKVAQKLFLRLLKVFLYFPKVQEHLLSKLLQTPAEQKFLRVYIMVKKSKLQKRKYYNDFQTE